MINIQTYDKQYQALQYLLDKENTEIFWGGALMTGKSYLACLYSIYMCITYPGVRGALCRSRLSNLIKSTFATFMDMINQFGLADHITYNSQQHIVKFDNGSQIFLLDLFPLPGDPNFTRLGGVELTFCIIDEVAEVALKAYLVLKTRIRYRLQENGLIGKMLLCSNPTTGWVKEMFYDAWRDGTLPKYRKFIPALPHDNPFADPNVLKTYTIDNLGHFYYEMLVKGNWDFASSDLDLFNIDDLNNMFHVNSPQGIKYITVDVAAAGSDESVIVVWDGYNAISIQTFKKNTIPQLVNHIKNAMLINGVKISNVCVDATGIGSSVCDYLQGCKRAIANARPLKDERGYESLKSQLYFKLSELVKEGKIGIICDAVMQEEIVKELQSVRMFNVDKERTGITPKALIRQQLGRSPDIADALSLRSYFEYKTTSGRLLIGGF